MRLKVCRLTCDRLDQIRFLVPAIDPNRPSALGQGKLFQFSDLRVLRFRVRVAIKGLQVDLRSVGSDHTRWSRLYSPDRAHQVARRLPRVPVKGRWGSITDAEDAVLRAGQKELVQVFCEGVVTLRKTKSSKQKVADNSDVLETEQDYTERMNKWVQDAHTGLSSLDFWLNLHVGHATRLPNDHARRWLQKARKDNRGGHVGRAMIDFVCRVSNLIFEEWSALLDTSATAWRPFMDLLEADSTGEEVRADWMAKAIVLIIEEATDFFRRIVLPCLTWPHLLLWSAFQPVGISDPERARCAADLLASPDNADPAARKIRTVFFKDLKHIAETGTTTEPFHSLISDIARHWEPDTQEIEGVNSILSHMVELSPNISTHLLSSRLTINKHVLGLHSDKNTDRIDGFVQSCEMYHKRAAAYVDDKDVLRRRFDMISLEDYKQAQQEVQDDGDGQPHLAAPPAVSIKRAAKLLAALKQRLLPGELDPCATRAFQLNVGATTSTFVWLSALSFRWQHWMVQGVIGEADSPANSLGKVVITCPLVCRPLRFLLEDLAGDVPGSTIAMLTLRWYCVSMCRADITDLEVVLNLDDMRPGYGRLDADAEDIIVAWHVADEIPDHGDDACEEAAGEELHKHEAATINSFLAGGQDAGDLEAIQNEVAMIRQEMEADPDSMMDPVDLGREALLVVAIHHEGAHLLPQPAEGIILAKADKLLGQWASSVQKAAAAVDALGQPHLQDAKAKALSLAMVRKWDEEDCSQYLHWIWLGNFDTLEGRITYLGQSNRVVYQPKQECRSFQEQLAR